MLSVQNTSHWVLGSLRAVDGQCLLCVGGRGIVGRHVRRKTSYHKELEHATSLLA